MAENSPRIKPIYNRYAATGLHEAGTILGKALDVNSALKTHNLTSPTPLMFLDNKKSGYGKSALSFVPWVLQ